MIVWNCARRLYVDLRKLHTFRLQVISQLPFPWAFRIIVNRAGQDCCTER